MSDQGTSRKNDRRRSSSSSSYSSTSSESSREAKIKDKKKEQLRPTPTLAPLNKISLDIGYKIQQEELSDSDSDGSSSPAPSLSQTSLLKYSSTIKDKEDDRSQSKERRVYRSPSSDKLKDRSTSRDSRKDNTNSKDFKRDIDTKISPKLGDPKMHEMKDRSKSRDGMIERSSSRDRSKRRSRSRERRHSKSPSREKRKERSRSRDRRRSKSKDRLKDKKRERSRSREKRREKSRRASRSPSYYKDRKYAHSKRDRSRERSSRSRRSRSRSRSRPHKRSRSRSRSFDRSKRLYDKKINKLSILEKLGIELKVPEGQVAGVGGANAPGFTIPSYYNPAGVNPLKYAQQMQKRKLIWGSKKQEGESSAVEKKEAEEPKPDPAGPESVWKGTTFSQDQDGKLTAKFKRLMGIKDAGGSEEGILAREIELVHISTGKPSSEKWNNVAIGDRFRFKIPITDQVVLWEVIFNCSMPHCPPDFELNDLDFFYSLTVESAEELLPSLCDWDYRKDKALINVISELRSAYLRYQVEKLGQMDNRFGYEYSSLIIEGRVPAENVEVFVEEPTVSFFIKLDVNVPYIPLAEDYFIVLGVRFGTLSLSCNSTLFSSLNVNRSLDTDIALPHTIKSDESLWEYTEEVIKSIEHQVLDVTLKRQKKRYQFIFWLMKDMGKSVISYDAIEYKSAVFLLQKDGFFCIMEVTIPDMFPSCAPSFRLVSCYMSGPSGQPLCQAFAVPFSNAWDIPTMVQQSVNLIFDNRIRQFRELTVSVFKLSQK